MPHAGGVDVSHHLSLYYPTNGSTPTTADAEAEAHTHRHPNRHEVGNLSAAGTSSVLAKGSEDTLDAIAPSADTAPHHAENIPTTVRINTPVSHPDEGTGGCCGSREHTRCGWAANACSGMHETHCWRLRWAEMQSMVVPFQTGRRATERRCIGAQNAWVESQQRLMALSEQALAADLQNQQITSMPRVPQRHQLTVQQRKRITPVPDSHRHRRTPSRDKDTVAHLLGAHHPKPKAQVRQQWDPAVQLRVRHPVIEGGNSLPAALRQPGAH